jgi:hypothetical protein
MHASALRFSLVVGLASALCACGGGGGGSSSGSGGTPTPPVSNASPGGIWQGIDPISRLPVYALAAEDGRFQLIVDDAAPVTQYWGTLVTSGSSLSSSNIQVAKGPTYLGTARGSPSRRRRAPNIFWSISPTELHDGSRGSN